MTEIKNEEWKHWVGPDAWNCVPKEERTCVSFAFPVMNPFPPHEWMVFKPFTNDFMIVDHDTYMEYWKELNGPYGSRYK